MSPKAAAGQHRGSALDRNCTVVSTSMRSPPDDTTTGSPPDAAVNVGADVAAAVAYNCAPLTLRRGYLVCLRAPDIDLCGT